MASPKYPPRPIPTTLPCVSVGDHAHRRVGLIIYWRFEEREVPKITKPTDAVIRLSATCICGSDLWPCRGIQPIAQPTPMGHEYCGIVEEVGKEVKKIKPGQFVVGSFATSDNTCVICSTGISPRACNASS